MERTDLGNDSWIEKTTLPGSLEFDFESLWSLHPEEYGKVIIQGKMISTPRWQQSYMRTYSFAGLAHEALPLPREIQPFLDWANTLYPGFCFNQVLVNWYLNGHHYIGPHSDNTWQLFRESPIFVIVSWRRPCFQDQG